MELIWLGLSCFRIKSREAVVLTDPFDKSIGYPIGTQTADIVTVSHQHAGHANVRAVAGDPQVVAGPGEYEIKGVMITGIQTYHDSEKGKLRGKNTAYILELDGVVICHLGDLGHVPDSKQVEAMATVDVLLVPVGGAVTINAAQAAEVISLIEPKLVIPMHYQTDGLKAESELDSLDKFLREMGIQHPQPQPKVSVTKSNLPEEPQVVILELRRS